MSGFPDPVAFRASLPERPFSPAWSCVLKAVYGTELDADERALFVRVSGGVEPRPGGWLEVFINAGRGGGKDDAIKTVANFECLHGGHEIAGARGQRIPFPIICPLRNQALGTVRMVQGEAQLSQVKRHVTKTLNDAVEFKNGTVVQVWSCDDVAVVGDTTAGYCRNEWALWPDDEAVTPGRLIEQNLRPTLRRPEGAPPKRVFGISSSYTTEGEAWETFRDYYGVPDAPVLVVKGSTLEFNPNTDRAWLESERKRMGEVAYAMHFECEWRSARLDGWFGTDVVDGCVDRGRSTPTAPEPQAGVRYYAGLDSAFRGDGFTLAIAHREQTNHGRVETVLDGCWIWRAPRGGVLSVERTVRETARILRSYHARAYCDQFSFDPLRALYQQHDVFLHEATWTAQNKAPTFRRVRDAMIDRSVRLTDDPPLIREFHNISGKLLKSGAEQITARTGHDDRVHAAVRALAEALNHEPGASAELFVMPSARAFHDLSRRRARDYTLPYAQRCLAFLRDETGDESS